ncbi:MAG: hypothetical protein ACREL9_13025, partial [Gemmatimonadales bacterium]
MSEQRSATPAPRGHRLTRPDLAAAIVADIIKQKVEEVKHAKQEARRPRERSRAWVIVLGLPLVLGLTGWNLLRVRERPVVFTATQVDAGVRFKIYLAVQAVETYRQSLGRLPPDLGAVGMDGDGLTYRRTDSTYTIAAEAGAGSDGAAGTPLYEYRSGDDLTPFADGYAELAHKIGGGGGVP